MSKKKIGVITTFKQKNGSLGLNHYYYKFLNQLGEIILLTHENEIREDLDLLVLTGGADVNPARYGAIPELDIDRSDIYKEYFDEHKLPGYIKAGVPVFGICRGHQSLAVLNGMSLHQLNGHENSKGYYYDNHSELAMQTPESKENSLGKLLGEGLKTNFEINSLHHQSVTHKSATENNNVIISVVGKDQRDFDFPEKGGVEALIYKNIHAITVQWHPELIYDEYSINALNYLLEAKGKPTLAELEKEETIESAENPIA